MKMYFDGACEPNPGTGAVGYVILDGSEVLHSGSFVLPGKSTNNEAEYRALLTGVAKAHQMGWKDLDIFGDSKLVVNQVNGDWRSKKEHLTKLRDQVQLILSEFDSWTLTWIGRDGNSQADELSKRALKAVGIEPRY